MSAISDDTGRWYAAHVLVLVGLVLALPAFLGIAHILEGRRPVLANLGSIAFVLLAGIGLYIAQLCPRWAAALVALMQLVGFVSELTGGPKRASCDSSQTVMLQRLQARSSSSLSHG